MHPYFRKVAGYLLIAVLVAVPFAGYILVSRYLFPLNTAFFLELPILIMLAVLIHLIWRKGQARIDRWVYGKRYDLLKDLRDFNREVHDISDISRYGYRVVSLIDRVLQSSHSSILLLTEAKDYRAIATTHSIFIALSGNDPGVDMIRKSGGAVHKDEIVAARHRKVKTGQPFDGIDLYAPLLTRNGMLEGIIALGPKKSSRGYSAEDIKLIITMSRHVSIELENARLYDLEKSMRKSLQQQDRHKSELLHSIAHEMKTPLTALISSSEMLTDIVEQRQTTSEQNLVRNINRSAWWMNNRVTELIDMARIHTGHIALSITPVDMRMVIEDVTSRMRYLFSSRGQQLQVEVAEPISLVRGDIDRIEQILFNLLANANKYSSANSVIMLHAAQNSSKVVVDIADAGPVVNDRDRHRIFDPYYRGSDDIVKSRFPGLGLGLAICKQLVELHQGSIWVTPVPGKGNIFSFSIPVRSYL